MAALVAGCFEYSPHELPDARSLNARATRALLEGTTLSAETPFRFAVVGDTQRSYDDAADCVAALNRRDDLAFVVQVGDFTDNGLTFEYEEMAEVFEALRVPWFVVVGNHDLLGNGRAIYEHLFGPTHFAFDHGGVRFLVLDTNGLEASWAPDVPDLEWMERQLEAGGGDGRVVVLSHVATRDSEFNPQLRERFTELLRRPSRAIAIYGHAHTYRSWEEDGVPMVGADSVDHRSYLAVTVGPEGFDVALEAF